MSDASEDLAGQLYDHSAAGLNPDMSDHSRDVAGQVYAAVNRGDFVRMSELMADDFVEHEEVPGFEPNKQGVLQFFGVLREAFPDLSMTVEGMVVEGDMVAARLTMSGTHRGEFMGMPASGNEIHVPVADFFRVRRGQIAEHWGLSDMAVMVQQMGGDSGT